MNVLLLGRNFASVINSYCIGLGEHGVKYKALSFEYDRLPYNNYSHIETVYKDNKYCRIAILQGLLRLRYYVSKADVIHVFSDLSIDGRLQSLFEKMTFRKGKKLFISFLGSDVRIPEWELKLNPYFRYAWDHPQYEGRNFESLQQSSQLQRKFSDWGFQAIANIETEPFLMPEYFKEYYGPTHNPSTNIDPISTQAQSDVVNIIHAPTSYYAKGSGFVIEAIKKLEAKGIKGFSFRLLTGISNEEYKQCLREAHIYVDQFIWGWHGVAAQQALEYGKVVVAYLHPDRLKKVPDCPIENATIDNLADVLEHLITDHSYRARKAAASIDYYRKYHSPGQVAASVLDIYSGTASSITNQNL